MMYYSMQQVFRNFAVTNNIIMIQLQKYTWLIDTIRRAGKISLEEISDCWERNKDLSDYKPLSRATFNRWKDAIFSQFGIIISCQRAGGYLYYIGEFYQFNLSSCIRQQNSLTAQFVSFSLSNLANIFYPPQFLQ